MNYQDRRHGQQPADGAPDEILPPSIAAVKPSSTVSGTIISVAIGIVAYDNSEDELNRLARSLDAAIAFARRALTERGTLNTLSSRILVYNNGSPRSSLGALADVAEVFQDGTNHGFGWSQNALMREAFAEGADYYVGLNPDGMLHPHALVELLDMAARFRGEALIEATMFPSEHPKPFDPLTFDTPWTTAACFVMPAQLFKAVGGFDENMFLYCEDIELSWRVRLAGYKTKICPRALFYHSWIHRWDNSIIRRRMLLSARYMAAKWGNPDFCRYVEGMLGGAEPLPEIGPMTFRGDNRISDFDHELNFAPHRWVVGRDTLDRTRRHCVGAAETVDVLVRFHDVAQTDRLGRCLFSLYCQTHPSVQPVILLQNFSSTDIRKVEALVDDFAWGDRLRPIVYNVETQKPGDCRSHLLNVGIAKSKARYLAILDYDDLVYQYAYDYLVDRLVSDDVAIAIGSVLRADITPMRGFDYVLTKYRFGQGADRFDMFVADFCPPMGFLLDRTRFAKEDLCFDESLPKHEDYCFLLRTLVKYPSSFAAVGTTMGEYCLRTDGSNSVLVFDEFNPAKQRDWQRYDEVVADLKNKLTVTLTVKELERVLLRRHPDQIPSPSQIQAQYEEKMNHLRLMFVTSTSWRITAPLRALSLWLRGRR